MDINQLQRIIGRAFFPAPRPKPQPVNVTLPPPVDYTLPLLALGGIAIFLLGTKK